MSEQSGSSEEQHKRTELPIERGYPIERVNEIAEGAADIIIGTQLVAKGHNFPLLTLVGVKDWGARGFAMGTASHGIGTARAFQVNPTAGAYAGIAMALNALLTSMIVPVLVRWLL
mgnify:CR=1 FL=1